MSETLPLKTNEVDITKFVYVKDLLSDGSLSGLSKMKPIFLLRLSLVLTTDLRKSSRIGLLSWEIKDATGTLPLGMPDYITTEDMFM